jgi:NTP pyrophosphatase (non-canonical NTP hydrolase)
MQRALNDNDHKDGWDECSLGYLFGRLGEEVQELKEAMQAIDRDPELIVSEAADVANFAMMIADNVRPTTDMLHAKGAKREQPNDRSRDQAVATG